MASFHDVRMMRVHSPRVERIVMFTLPLMHLKAIRSFKGTEALVIRVLVASDHESMVAARLVPRWDPSHVRKGFRFCPRSLVEIVGSLKL